MESANASGKLVIVPTPIGNLGDMTLRSLEALREADVVCAEDTRVTGKLLAHFGIEKRLARLDEAMIGSRAAGVVERVAAGEVVAYCSDAGMPGVSDPGLRLVAAAREAGVAVEVLPGASAAACAYVASGTVCPRFYFGGFFPRKATEQRTVLAELSGLDAALVFYESPNRLVAALSVIAEVLPWRPPDLGGPGLLGCGGAGGSARGARHTAAAGGGRRCRGGRGIGCRARCRAGGGGPAHQGGHQAPCRRVRHFPQRRLQPGHGGRAMTSVSF